MFDFSKLMALSEAANGFDGGTLIDEMPEYTLEECVSTLPVVIIESQVEHYSMISQQNDAMVESVISSINGASVDYDALIEASKTSLKDRFLAFLQKIKKFIVSIIVKIKALFARRKGDASKLISKYDKIIDKNKLGGLTFTGYTFEKDVLKTSIPGGISEIVGKIAPGLDGGLNDPKASSDQIKAMGDEDHAARAMKVATEVTGISLTNKETWANDLTKELMGIKDEKNPKVEMKYGDYCFTYERVKNMLNNHAELQKLLKSYQTMQSDIEKQINECKKLQKDTDNTDANKSKLEYYNVYILVYQDCANAMTKVNSSVKHYTDLQWVQGSQMWVAMAQYSKSGKGTKSPEAKKEEKEEKKDSTNKFIPSNSAKFKSEQDYYNSGSGAGADEITESVMDFLFN